MDDSGKHNINRIAPNLPCFWVIFHLFILHAPEWTCVTVFMWRSEDNLSVEVALFLSGPWGIECWWSGLTASTLTSWVISPALLFLIAYVPVWYVCLLVQSSMCYAMVVEVRGWQLSTFPGRISLSFWGMTYSKLTGSRASGRSSSFYLPFSPVFQVCAAAAGFLYEYQEFHSVLRLVSAFTCWAILSGSQLRFARQFHVA